MLDLTSGVPPQWKAMCLEALCAFSKQTICQALLSWAVKCNSNSHFNGSIQQNAVQTGGWNSPCGRLNMTLLLLRPCGWDPWGCAKELGPNWLQICWQRAVFLWPYGCSGPQTTVLITMPQSRTTATGILMFCPVCNCSLQAGFCLPFLDHSWNVTC